MPDKTMDAKTDRLSVIINSILKPLRFAFKDNYAHLNAVKGLEPLVISLSREAFLTGLDKGGSLRFKELQDLFSGFDNSSEEIKKERIDRAFEILGSFGRETSIERELTPDDAIRMMGLLKTPLERVKGIGPKLAGRLKNKGLCTVEDVLYFLPIRYEDRRRIKEIRELTPGATEVTTGSVMAMGEVRYGRRKVFEMAVGDGSGLLKVKWFHYRLPYMKRFRVSQKLVLFGTVSVYGRQPEMIHPDIEIIDGDEARLEKDFGGIVPVYSQVENFHQKTIRKIIRNIVEGFADFAIDGVPAEVRRRLRLMDIRRAFKEAHMPSGEEGISIVELAKKSLVFDELFLLELGLAVKRTQTKKEGGIAFFSPDDGRFKDLEGKLRSLLPFKLTRAQDRVLDEIRKDMSDPHPMNRLVQGDVGSGKTIVSFISALRAIESGYQAALMAPTEILAEQHYLSTRAHAEALGIRTILLTGSSPKAMRDNALRAIRGGETDLIIGTHALIQKDVEFCKLGLIIIDEQHRFGVVQRSILRKRGFGRLNGSGGEVFPDMLIMTATPIPRTLSMTVFGDLDVSIIDELPPGRTPVHTRILREKDRLKAYDFIKKELASKSQCYIVYPLVEESEELSLKDATNMKEHLARDIFTEFNVGLLHGRMKPAEKESVMRDFKDRKIDILVSTTVIEVGVDVPNATVMLIEHAERFGLAQLHQLRGRVGRGAKRSTCLLLAAWMNSEDTYKRLKVMEDTMDGFKIAEEDLKLRGPGDFLGTRQAGLPDFRTDALSDLTVLKRAREEAFKFIMTNPDFSGAEAGCLREILKERWTGRLELAEIG